MEHKPGDDWEKVSIDFSNFYADSATGTVRCVRTRTKHHKRSGRWPWSKPVREVEDVVEEEFWVERGETSPEREEAVAYFRRNADLIPDSSGILPPGHWSDPIEELKAHLPNTPVPPQFGMLKLLPPRPYGSPDDPTIVSKLDGFSRASEPYDDMTLERLKHLPELTRVHILSGDIGDEGLSGLRHLRGLRGLVVYSRHVTDGCLAHIARLKTLESLDMQRAPNVSRTAFDRAVRCLPKLRDIYPPHNGR